VIDRGAVRGNLEAAVEAAVAAGVDWIQVRERDLPAAALLDFASCMANAALRGARRAGRPLKVLVNRRADIALAIGADGVHLGFDAMDVDAARQVLGAAALVGVSTHSAAEALDATAASYVQLAPIYAPLSKAATRPALGPAAVADAASGNVPILAQGGVDAGNAAALCAAGAQGVAVTGAILMQADPAAAAAALRRALDGGEHP
jgi:thiamine-phosphate pyrophosphorylase